MSEVLTLKAPFVGNDGRPLIEPGAFFLDGNYSLRVNSWNALAGVIVTVRARLIRASDGELVDSSWDHTPNTNRTKATNDFPLPAGFILNVTAFASSGTPLVGQTFVQVQLARGLSGATLLLGTLLQDYVTSVQALAYPGSPIRSSIEGGGVVRTIAGTLPAAGAEISETVPTGARWQLLGLGSLITTAAGGVARLPALLALSPGSALTGSLQALTTPPASSQSYLWSAGLGDTQGAAGFWATASWSSEFRFLAGQQIATRTNNIAAGDQWNAPAYSVMEWLEAAA